jgi:hypothetical protein
VHRSTFSAVVLWCTNDVRPARNHRGMPQPPITNRDPGDETDED